MIPVTTGDALQHILIPNTVAAAVAVHSLLGDNNRMDADKDIDAIQSTIVLIVTHSIKHPYLMLLNRFIVSFRYRY